MLTTTKRCLNSKFAKKHLILNGKSFVATLLPDSIKKSQDKKKRGGVNNKTKKYVLLPHSTQLSATFLQLLPTVLSSEVIKERCLLPDFSQPQSYSFGSI